jgi:hypothetical protein
MINLYDRDIKPQMNADERRFMDCGNDKILQEHLSSRGDAL